LWCSIFATTRRGLSQLSAWYGKSEYQTTGSFDGRPNDDLL
jgi:hypothetical protein